MEGLKNYRVLPVDKLVQAKWNYKEEDEDLMEVLITNIRKNGQIENIIVREISTDHGPIWEVVNGNHRLQALRKLKISECMVYDLGELSLAAAQRIALETNETKFQADGYKLGGLLQELTMKYDMDDLTQTLPYSEGEIHNYMDLLEEYEPEEPPEEERNPNAPRQVTIYYKLEDEKILQDLQSVVDNYPGASMK